MNYLKTEIEKDGDAYKIKRSITNEKPSEIRVQWNPFYKMFGTMFELESFLAKIGGTFKLNSLCDLVIDQNGETTLIHPTEWMTKDESGNIILCK